jgi:hypothetical protein
MGVDNAWEQDAKRLEATRTRNAQREGCRTRSAVPGVQCVCTRCWAGYQTTIEWGGIKICKWNSERHFSYLSHNNE